MNAITACKHRRINMARGLGTAQAHFRIILFEIQAAIHLIKEIALFLDAPSHLYKRVCPSVRRSVTPSLRGLLGASYAEYSALLKKGKRHIEYFR